jgi:hypothetical protein
LKPNNLRTGDLIKGRIKRLPFIFHYGYILESPKGLYVVHNTPKKTNSRGGGINIDIFEDWIKTRELINYRQTKVTESELIEAIDKYSHIPFNLFHWNCEHFVTQVQYNKPSSQQLKSWLIASINLIFVVYTLRKRKIFYLPR